jgi:hypothetical protein
MEWASLLLALPCNPVFSQFLSHPTKGFKEMTQFRWGNEEFHATIPSGSAIIMQPMSSMLLLDDKKPVEQTVLGAR